MRLNLSLDYVMPQKRATRFHLPANNALSERARQAPVSLPVLWFLSDSVTVLEQNKQWSLAYETKIKV